MISLNNLSLMYGDRSLLDNMNITINSNQRIGLVGRNGSGKSTLLKIIAGSIEPDSGSVSITGKKTVAYLPQEVTLASEGSIFQEAYSALATLQALEDHKKSLEIKIEQFPDDTDLLTKYANVCDQLNLENPSAARAQVTRILLGLGFRQTQLDEPVSSLSIGWRMRIVLAKLLLQEADFYLFDEPTNHLDIIATRWLIQFLKQSNFGFIIVCHERKVLDELCSSILELELGRNKLYNGNYSKYEAQKETDSKQLEQAYHQQQREIKQKMATINRFRAKPSKAKMARSMLKALEKMERIELPPRPKNIHLTFPPTTRSGRSVLKVNHVAHTFGSKQIFKDVSFEVLRNQRVAIVAPNGVGKTTLFNLIANKLALQTGTIEYGQNIQLALFDQDQSALLDPKQTVLETVQTACTNIPDQVIRKFLGAFLFSNDEVDKKTKVLSGGERNRLGMVRVLLENANLLLLDEPTNHLDIMSKDALLNALRSYDGTIVFVSHDQYFIEKLATSVIELTPNGADVYQGDYSSYLYQKEQNQSNQTNSKRNNSSKTTEKLNSKEQFALRKKCRSLENKIEKLETEISSTQEAFATLQYGTEKFFIQEQKLLEQQSELEQAMTEWEKVQEALEK